MSKEVFDFQPQLGGGSGAEGQPIQSERERAIRLSKVIQQYEVGDDGVTLFSPYYHGGQVYVPFNKMDDGGRFHKRMRDAGQPEGGRQ